MIPGTARTDRRYAGMDDPRKIWLVCNPGSGSNHPDAVAALQSCCGEHGFEVARRIGFPDEPLPTAAQLDAAGIDCLAVYAGDGTVNSCVSALYGWGGAVLVLPGGTMNLLARRLHGDAATEQIVANAASGGARPVRPLVARTRHGDGLAGLLAGPGTAWYAVREAMREADVAGIVAGASEALAETTGGPMLHCREPALGRETGYPLIEITPGEWGLQLDGYYAESAGDHFAQGWAMLRRRFREGPHDRIGLTGAVTLASEDGGSIGLLIDGEQVEGGAQEEIAVARCEVDLIATFHG
ncbi:MAG TPA: diacylglycerol kinase family protein [Croceibacterium sp.]|nr:diacylglycerol kinase family protein [Croceibacterium sp.]